MSELQKYRKLLKENEAAIKRLTAQNKHIKDHIKFLEGMGEEVEEEESTVVEVQPE